MIMKNQIILPIFEEKSNRFSKVIAILFICGLVGTFLNIFFLNSMLLYCFTIGIIILSGVIMGVLNVDKCVGTLILTELTININNKEIIPIEDVKDMKITIGGFEGRRGLDNLRSFYADNGKNNFIEFVNNNSHKKIRILVSSQNYDALINMVEVWKKNKIAFLLKKT
jgi:hypothetical protein